MMLWLFKKMFGRLLLGDEALVLNYSDWISGIVTGVVEKIWLHFIERSLQEGGNTQRVASIVDIIMKVNMQRNIWIWAWLNHSDKMD